MNGKFNNAVGFERPSARARGTFETGGRHFSRSILVVDLLDARIMGNFTRAACSETSNGVFDVFQNLARYCSVYR